MRALLPFCLAAGIAYAQADLSAALDQIASAEVSKQKIPGAAVVVVKEDRIIYAAGLGVASLESKLPVTPETLFRLGSARVFLAAAISELSTQGRLHLGTPAGEYLF